MRIGPDSNQPASAQKSKQHILKLHPNMQLAAAIKPTPHSWSLGASHPKCAKIAQSTLHRK